MFSPEAAVHAWVGDNTTTPPLPYPPPRFYESGLIQALESLEMEGTEPAWRRGRVGSQSPPQLCLAPVRQKTRWEIQAPGCRQNILNLGLETPSFDAQSA